MVWVYLLFGSAVPLFSLLVLRSVWWTFALYHGFVCVLFPLFHSLVLLRNDLRGYLSDVALVPVKLRLGLVLGLTLGAASVAGLGVGREVLLTDRIDKIITAWGVDPASVPAMLVIMLLGNGAAEELFWRGWLHRRLETWTQRPLAVAVAGAAYASYHVATIGSFIGNPLAVGLLLGVVFGAGVFFGWLRERSASVWPPLLAHSGATAGYLLAYHIWVG